MAAKWLLDLLRQLKTASVGFVTTEMAFGDPAEAEKSEVVANCDHLRRLKFSPTLPSVFTEHGAIMAASVLNSQRAVEMSVFVVRAFLRLRDLAQNHADIVAKLSALERKVAGHDEDLKKMFLALRALLAPPVSPRRRIGFRA